jgi:hypothetical protein
MSNLARSPSRNQRSSLRGSRLLRCSGCVAGVALVFVAYTIGFRDEPLEPSSAVGLQGIPVPERAVLVEATVGDSDHDPTERYAIDARAEQIDRFFRRHLERGGWQLVHIYRSNTALWQRRDMGVIISIQDRGFWIMAGGFE